jgi:hypothetical protein
VYRLRGAPVTQVQSRLAAVLAAGPEAWASHLTATAVWGFPFFPAPDRIDVLVEGRTAPRLPGVFGHTTNSLPPEDRAVAQRVPVTSPERTLVDACSWVSVGQLGAAVSEGQRRRIVRLPRLVRTVDHVPVSGRRAIVPMIEVLKTRVPGFDPGDSDPEVDLVELLVSAGYPRPQQQIRVATDAGRKSLDVGWPEVRTGFEYDSLEYHQHRFHEDRDRLRALKRAGWDVWPITSTTTRNEILAIAALAFPQKVALDANFCGEAAEG